MAAAVVVPIAAAAVLYATLEPTSERRTGKGEGTSPPGEGPRAVTHKDADREPTQVRRDGAAMKASPATRGADSELRQRQLESLREATSDPEMLRAIDDGEVKLEGSNRERPSLDN